MATLNILHLSDLHFSDSSGHAWNQVVPNLAPHDQPTLLSTLLEDLTSLAVTPQLIIVSGDLIDKGAATGIVPVVDFLTTLRTHLSLMADRLFVVPGNHDVLREATDRYTAYDRIYEGLFQRSPFLPSTQPHQRVEARYLDDLGVEIVGFNSCEQANDTDYAGYIGNSQRTYAARLLRAGDHFRIAVMHHHLVAPLGEVERDLSVMVEGSTVRNWLAQNGFQLVLHGHQHVDWRNVHREDGSFHQSIVGGASAGVGDYGRSRWELRLGYQIVEVRGHYGSRMRRQYFRQERKWRDAAGGDPSRELWFGVQPDVAARPDQRAIQQPDSTEAAQPVAKDVAPTTIKIKRDIPQNLIEHTRARMAELAQYLRAVATALRAPAPGEEISDYLSRILEEEDHDALCLQQGFGLSQAQGERGALAILLRSQEGSLQPLKSVTAQRVDHILWRLGYTLELIDEDWSIAAQMVVSTLQSLCTRDALTRSPTLRDVHSFLSAGYMPLQFAESAPDPRVFAVLRGLSRPGPLGDQDLAAAKQTALDYLYETLKLEESTRGRFQDSSNAWWALRTGLDHDDERFAPLALSIARKFAEISVPDREIVRTADLPEIYVPLRTQAYTLSNAQNIAENSHYISLETRELLHTVILYMHEHIVVAPSPLQLYLASVQFEAFQNFLDYAAFLKVEQ
jgi:hypothetical protein